MPNRIKAGIAALGRLLEEDDPRVATHFHTLLLQRPYGGVEFELALLDLVVRAADPRSIEFLGNQVSFDGSHARAKLLAKFRTLPALKPPETRIVDSIRARLAELQATTSAAAARGLELLAAIRAEPNDDRPRAIYADWLLERNDPYGEFIALQLAGQATAREQQLVRKHGLTWMGPLGAIADPKQSRFTRGFLSSLVLHYRALDDELAAVAGVAEWWSVEALDRGDRLVPDPAMRSLRAIGVVRMELAHRLATSDPPLPLTSLGILLDLPAFPTTAPGLPQLQHLELVTHGHPLAASLVEVLRAPIARGLRSVALRAARVRFTLSADRAGNLTRLVIDATHPEPELVNEVRALAGAKALSHIELVVDRERQPRVEPLLRSALEEVPGLPPLVVTAMR